METRETTFTDCVKNFNIGMHSDIYEWTWFKLGKMIDTSILLYTLYFDTNLIDCDLYSRKQKLLHQLSHNVFSWFE